MILKRFYEERLAQASYLVGCAATGEALVIDPNLELQQYIEGATAENLRIRGVTETHLHADFVSGSRALAERTGATLYVSGEGGAEWQYAFAQDPNVKTIHKGDSIRIGNVRLDVLHTPGHTPEHVTFLLTDEPASAEPSGAFTGDFVFVGDVGRPDLLEKAAGQRGTADAAARSLFASLQNFATLPDRLLIWPGHGAGSACGKSLGGVPVSSIGYEKLANWAFRDIDEQTFVAKVLEDQPEPPRYFATMKRVNREGLLAPDFRAPSRLDRESASGARWIVDVRPAAQFVAQYLPGAVSIPPGRNLLAWAGSLLPYGEPLTLIANGAEQATAAARSLRLIGLNDITGWIGPELFEDAATTQVQHISADELAGAARGRVIVDVRGASEFRSGHIPESINLPLANLADTIGSLRKDTPILVHCQAGARSLIAYSLLKRLGYSDVADLTGGFMAYQVWRGEESAKAAS